MFRVSWHRRRLNSSSETAVAVMLFRLFQSTTSMFGVIIVVDIHVGYLLAAESAQLRVVVLAYINKTIYNFVEKGEPVFLLCSASVSHPSSEMTLNN